MAESLGDAILHLRTDDSGLDRGLGQAQQKVRKSADDMLAQGQRIRDVGSELSFTLTAPILATGLAAGKMAGDFEAAMIRVGISTGGNAKQLGEMRELARQLGKDTVFSATEAAEAMDLLAKNGLDATQILAGAAEAAATLATATGSELDPAVNSITDVMSQFKIQASDLPRIVNQITGAVNESKLDFADFSGGIAQGGVAAAAAGVSFEDFNAALAALSPGFASGSDAGTSFKAFLLALTPNSDEAGDAIEALGLKFYDAGGRLLPLGQIADNLREKLGGLSQEARSAAVEKIFGSDGMRTANQLMEQGAAGLDKVKAKILETDASAQAAQKMKGLNGQLKEMKDAFQDAAIAAGDAGLVTAFTGLVKGVTSLLQSMSGLNPVVLQIGMGFLGLLAAIGPVMVGVGTIMRGWGGLLLAGDKLKTFFLNLPKGIGAVNPVFLAIAAAVAVAYLAWQNWDKIKPIIDSLGSTIQSVLGPKLTGLIEQVKSAITALWQGPLGQAISVVISTLASLAAAFALHLGEGIIRTLGALIDVISGAFSQIVNLVNLVTAVLAGDWAGAWTAAKAIVSTSVNTVLNVLNTLIPGAREAILKTVAAMKGAIAGAPQFMIQTGKDIVAGLASGILGAGAAVWNALKSVVLAGVTKIREFLGIQSPSRLFALMGGQITDGLAQGILNGISTVDEALARLGNAVEKGGLDLSGLAAPNLDFSAITVGADDSSPTDPQDETADKWREGFSRWFGDGIQAALNGDLKGFLKDSFSRVFDGAFRSVLGDLGNSLSQLFGGSGGGGGLGGLIKGIFGGFGGGAGGGGGFGGEGGGGLAELFSGFFAQGGTIPSGEFGIVGERGPEAVFSTARGALIRPNSALSSLPQTRSGGTSISISIPVDATGADPAALARVQASLDRMRAELPTLVVETVNDASERRILGGRG